MDSQPSNDISMQQKRVVLVCEPVVATGGFVLCHEPGDTRVLHIHDHRQGPNPAPVAVIVRTGYGWSTHVDGEAVSADSIVVVFEQWAAVGVAATRMAATSTRS